MTARDVIAQALALSEAATGGPWVVDEPHNTIVVQGSDGYSADGSPRVVAEDVYIAADRTLIAAARTLLPALAKALGDVLDLADAADFSASMVYDQDCGLVHAHHLRAAITAALSEVTP